MKDIGPYIVFRAGPTAPSPRQQKIQQATPKLHLGIANFHAEGPGHIGVHTRINKEYIKELMKL